MLSFWGRVSALACVVAATVGLSGAARAQAYPDHPVRLIVAFGTGGTIDTLTRIIADKLGDMWKQGVIVDNRPGGSGNIGAAAAAHATPDGYTLHMGGQPLTANVTLAPTTTFDPVRDFDPIIFIAWGQDVLMVGKDSPYKTVKDLIAAAKANPGGLNYGSLGIGSSGHLATVLLENATDIRAQHVPYTSVGQLQADTTSGRINMWISTLGGQLGVIKGGNLRALAVSGEQRATSLPDVPTFKELGIPLIEPSTWFAMFAPKGTPREIIVKANADVNAIINAPDMRDKLNGLGFQLKGGSPEALAAAMAPDIAKWEKVSKTPAYSAQ
jgi:tripartite-type tricarboxylate transporter receptor subunit TctC